MKAQFVVFQLCEAAVVRRSEFFSGIHGRHIKACEAGAIPERHCENFVTVLPPKSSMVTPASSGEKNEAPIRSLQEMRTCNFSFVEEGNGLTSQTHDRESTVGATVKMARYTVEPRSAGKDRSEEAPKQIKANRVSKEEVAAAVDIVADW